MNLFRNKSLEIDVYYPNRRCKSPCHPHRQRTFAAHSIESGRCDCKHSYKIANCNLSPLIFFSLGLEILQADTFSWIKCVCHYPLKSMHTIFRSSESRYHHGRIVKVKISHLLWKWQANWLYKICKLHFTR